MKWRWFHIIFLLLAIQVMNAQKQIRLDALVADCEHAIDITGIDSLHATAPLGPGRVNEVSSSSSSLYAFKKEHHTVWYKFSVKQNCILEFTIIPDHPKDDYDFILFRADGEHSCEQIKKGELRPLRSNISRPAENSHGKTGLGNRAQAAYVHEGKGNNWSLPLKVKAGETYFLVLDNVYKGGGGHKLQFRYLDCERAFVGDNGKLYVNFNIRDEALKKPVEANLLLVDQYNAYPDYDTIYNAKVSSLSLAVQPGRLYSYELRAEGYLTEKDFFKLDSFSNHPVKIINIDMKRIEPGGTFEIDEIYFVGGSDQLIRKSYPALRKLLKIMRDNPSLEIEIEGHVNLPQKGKRETEEYYNALSVARAKAVFDYLKQRGVEASRMKYKGLGYSQMVYPNAKTPEEMQKNRRVIIRILKT